MSSSSVRRREAQTPMSSDLNKLMRSDLDAVDDAVAVTRYRILQEALTNIAKYAEAHSVGIDLETRDSNGREALRRAGASTRRLTGNRM